MAPLIAEPEPHGATERGRREAAAGRAVFAAGSSTHLRHRVGNTQKPSLPAFPLRAQPPGLPFRGAGRGLSAVSREGTALGAPGLPRGVLWEGWGLLPCCASRPNLPKTLLFGSWSRTTSQRSGLAKSVGTTAALAARLMFVPLLVPPASLNQPQASAGILLGFKVVPIVYSFLHTSDPGMCFLCSLTGENR